MGTRSVIYLDGEFLCHCGYDGQPYSLGEGLESVTSNWKDILKVCKPNAIWAVNVKYFIRDPKFVFDCFREESEKKEILEHYPEGVSEELLKACRKPDPDGVSGIEDILFKPPSELYEAPFGLENSYQYNHTNNMVFVRYDYKNFPWVPNDKVKRDEDDDTLWRIRDEMCGFIDSSDEDYEIIDKVRKDGPISSGREFLKVCKKATQLIPQDPNCWWNYGVALELLGRIDQAIEAYKIAIDLTPDNSKIWQILGDVYLKNGNKEKSIHAFGKAISNIKNLDYSKMGYYEQEYFEKNITQLYKSLLKAQFEDLIKPFNESIHSDIATEEAEFLASIQEKIGEPIFSVRTHYLGYEFERGRIIKLNLSEKNLKSLPESIGSLTSLEELDLNINWLAKLPDAMKNLSSLKKLNLKDNKLTSNSDWLKKLPLLEHLEIDPTIPEIDPQEKEVIELIEAEINRPLPVVRDFKERKVGYIAKNEHIIGLSLDLEYGYKLSSFPESISSLKNLEELNLRSNQLIEIPESLGNLRLLKKLDLGVNKLSSFPESISSLKGLEELNLHYNQLIEIPESIGSLISLKKLILNNNKLTNLPESISSLKNLEELNLRYNQLIEIPESIGSLISLKKLILNNNKLTNLPESVEKLGKNGILTNIEKVMSSQRKLKEEERHKLREKELNEKYTIKVNKNLVFKISLYGPSLVGKSTILNWLYDTESAREQASGGIQQESTKSILFFEWKMAKAPNVIFLIYTTIGDQNSQFIMDGTDAVIFIWDSLIDKWKENIRLLKELLRFYGDKLIPTGPQQPPDVPLVFLADNRDLEDIIEISKIRQVLDTAKLNHCLIYETIATKGANVKRAFLYATRQMVLNHYRKLSGKA